MKQVVVPRFFSMSCAAILLLSLAKATAYAVDGVDVESNARAIPTVLQKSLQQFFEGWHGSKTLTLLAALCLVLAIAARGIERR